MSETFDCPAALPSRMRFAKFEAAHVFLVHRNCALLAGLTEESGGPCCSWKDALWNAEVRDRLRCRPRASSRLGGELCALLLFNVTVQSCSDASL